MRKGVTNSTFNSNRIDNIKYTGTGGYGGKGIDIATGIAASNVTISNNMISNLGGDGWSTLSSDAIVGIRINASMGGVNLYYNSVHLTGSFTGHASGTASAALFINTGVTGLDIRNNIFSTSLDNTAVTTDKTWAINSASANTAFTNINYNEYWVSGAAGVLGFLTSDRLTLPDIVAGFGQNANSINADPAFTSTSDLHIPTGTSSQLESGGSAVGGIITDFDGQARPGPAGSVNGGGTAPDIGADEFDGVPALPMTYVSSTATQNNVANINTNSTNQEIIGLQIVTMGVLSPLSATSFTLNTNGTTLPADITNAKLWYTGSSAIFATTTQFGATFSSPSGSFNITGNQALISGTNYFWLTYDIPCIATPGNLVDAEFNSLTVGTSLTPGVQAPSGSRTIVTGPLSGTKTIGTGGDYATLTAAIAVINASGLSSNTTLSILNSITEPAAVVINQWTECGAGNYFLFIKPAPSTTPTITANSTIATLKINGADRVIIDGSNNGTSTKDLTFENINPGTSSGVLWIASTISSGATDVVVRNTIFKGFGGLTTFGSLIASGTVLGGVAEVANANLLISNNTAIKSQYGIAVVGNATGQTGTTIIGNTIGSNTPSEYISFRGLFISNATSANVSNNNIFNIVTSATNPTGIFITGGVTSSTFNANRVDNVTYTGTGSSGGKGIDVNTGSLTSNVTLSNNMISNIGGDGASSLLSGSIIGIRIGATGGSTSTTGGINLYHNSVNLTGSFFGNTFGTSSAALYISSTATALDIRNNIFVSSLDNTATGTDKTWSINSAGANTAFTNINYNDYSVSGAAGILGFLSSDRLTLADIQSGFGGNANSLNVAPVFTSASDLHLPGASNVSLNNFGVPLAGVTTDYDGETRDVAMPDMGGDEFTPVTGIDVGISGLLSPAASGCYTNAESVTVTIKNYSLNPIDFSVNNVMVTVTASGGYSSSVTLNTGVLASNGVQNVTLPATIDMSMNGSYTFNAFTSIVTDVTPANDAMTPVTRTALTLSGGTFAIGTGQSGSGGFETFTSAVAAYNSASCITGPVVFNLMDPTFSTGESFPITINANAAAGASTLTIKPSVTTAITGNVSGALIIVNGGDNIIIDGSIGTVANTVCPASTATRNLTITNLNTGSSSAVIWLQTIAGNPATNNIIRNLNIAGSGVTGNTGTLIGIGSGSSIIGLTSLGTGNHNNQFINNSISKVQFGIVSQGASALLKNTGTVINQNVMTAIAPNQVSRVGILVGFDNGVLISGNHIANLSGTSGNDAIAISLGTSSVSNSGITGNEVTNAIISKNVINSIRSASTWSAIGIAFVTTANAGTNEISNNMINDVVTNGTASDFGASIFLGGGTAATNVYYNTINMTAQLTGGAFDNFGIAVAGSNPTVDIRNNIIVNSSTNGTGFSYALGFAYSTYTNLTSDFNDLFTSGTASKFVRTGSLASAAGTDYTTLAAWQAASSKDAASLNFSPVFVSATDLHIDASNAINAPLNNGGTPVSVTDDIDCETRMGDIGADEFSAGCSTVVTNTNDTGAGSLRAVIACAPEGSTITFAPALLNQTIVLDTLGEIIINKNLTISGLGMLNLSVSGNNTSRIFNILSSKTVEIENMSLINAYSLADGGAIYSAGNLILENILLQNNFEGGDSRGWSTAPGIQVQILGNVDIKL